MNAENLVRAANRRGITQEAIAEITATSQPTISRYLSGMGSERKDVDQKIRYRLMHHLQCVEFAGDHFILRAST